VSVGRGPGYTSAGDETGKSLAGLGHLLWYLDDLGWFVLILGIAAGERLEGLESARLETDP
jgi:hypothetical protein